MDILIRPLVTEKASAQNEVGKYGFVVNEKANKLQIRDAVEKMYGVNVVDVNTMRYGRKNKTRYTKSGILKGMSSSYKKAIVQVADGEIIDFYSGI